MRGDSEGSEDTNLSVSGVMCTSVKEWTEEIMSQTVLHSANMNNLVMNYLVTEGFKEAAQKFAEEAGVSPGMDLSLMDDRIKIRAAIQEGRTQEAMNMVTTLHPEILDDNSQLFFHLQQLVLLEMIRCGQVEQAVLYAQEHLAEKGAEDRSVRLQLERTLALLAYQTPSQSPFADLLHPQHRQKVAAELNAAILRAQLVRETSPLLSELLRLLLWAQDSLAGAGVSCPRMVELSKAVLEAPQ